MNKPSESDIAKHAYHLWEREGRPHGRDQQHWHTAEREILGAATAKEDRPIGEVRSAEQSSVRQTSERQTGSTPPGRPAQAASPGVTQAAAAGKPAPQAQGERPGAKPAQAQAAQPAKQQQTAAGKAQLADAKSESSPARKPRAGSKQTGP